MDVRSFGAALRRFALAVDVVDDDVLDQVGGLASQYVADELHVEHFEIMREQMVGGEPGLGTLWNSVPGESHHAWPVRNGNDRHTAQVARAYESGNPLWVVASDGAPLTEADRVTDLWSGATELPAYSPPVEDSQPRTSIILPLQVGSRRIGAMCLDSPRHLEITPVAREELKLAAEAIAILYWNYEATRGSRTATKSAIGELQQVLAEPPFRQLTKPHVFVASSACADGDVVEAITDVLARDEFRDRITPMPWQENSEPGSVDQQIIQHVREAKFGICYLSEPGEEGAASPGAADGDAPPGYRDNPNVLFEAGMLHALTGIDYSGGWVPVREPDAPPAPFDVANQNHLIVPRHDDGSLNRSELEERLARHIRELLGPDADDQGGPP